MSSSIKTNTSYRTELNRALKIAREKNNKLLADKYRNDKLSHRLLQVNTFKRLIDLHLEEKKKYSIKTNFIKCSLDSEALIVPLWKRRGINNKLTIKI